MLQKCSLWRVFSVFLEEPLKIHYIKEIARKINLAHTSVKNHLLELEKEELISKKEGEIYAGFIAERDNENFILYKKLSILYELRNSGLVDYLWQTLSPDALILYGSYAKGDSIETSDVDLFVIGKEKKINLKKYEKILGKTIHLMFDPNVKHIPKELKNNLINGIVLKGYFKAL